MEPIEKLRSVLITDRTQQDVDRAKYLLSLFDKSGVWRGSQAEREELEASKGIYTPADINRVLMACSWLAGRIEKNGYNIPGEYFPAVLASATAQPADGGDVRGALGYVGETVAVTAAQKEDFFFLGWTEDGEFVSWERKYSFPAESDRDLTAVFVAAGSEAEDASGVVDIGRVGMARVGWKGV